MDKRSRTILISNISCEETVEGMTKLVSSYGAIESVKHYRSPDTSPWNMSVLFQTLESAQAAAVNLRLMNIAISLATDGPAKLDRKKVFVNPVMCNLEEDDCFEAALEHAFEDYHPTYINEGVRHPGSLVESTSLSSAILPQISYDISLPEYVQLRLFFFHTT